MKIITAANNKFKDIVVLSSNQNSQIGYKTHIYSIDNSLGFGENFDTKEYNNHFINNYSNYQNINLNKFYINDKNKPTSIPIGRLPIKPWVIKKALLDFKENIVWLDADAFCIKPINKVFEQNFDIAFTTRPAVENNNDFYPILNGLINNGVIFLKYTTNTIDFLDQWINEVPKTKFISDQEASNRAILNYDNNINLNNINSDIFLKNIHIKLLSTLEYNYYYYPKLPPEKTKVIHIKNNIRKDNILNDWFYKNWQY